MNKFLFLLLIPVFSLLYIANDSNTAEDAFMMPVEDVFSISGRGTVVTGKIERGLIKVGDSVELVGLSNEVIKSKVMSIEASMKSVKEASKDENVGLMLSAVKTSDIKRGMVVCKPGSVKAYSEFTCRIYLMTKAEGGRSTPIFNAYRPQFYFYNVGITGEIILPEGKESLSPGDNATVTVKLLTPVALEKEMEFNIREGSRTVGKGNVASFIR